MIYNLNSQDEGKISRHVQIFGGPYAKLNIYQDYFFFYNALEP